MAKSKPEKLLRRACVETLESRLHLSATRPAYNTGTGFFVLNGKLYDANGNEFVMKGPNTIHAWGSYNTNYNTIDQIAKTGANAARVVVYQDITSDTSNPWTDAADTPARRQVVAERYIANGMAVIMDDHTSIADSASQSSKTALDEITAHWLTNQPWLKTYEKYVILNIANEWGQAANNNGSNVTWRDAYIDEVTKLRKGPDNTLGTSDDITNTLMIDAGQWGQDYFTLKLHAQQILDADPQKNIVFSIHLYSQWRDESRSWEVSAGNSFGPWDVSSSLTQLRAANLPLIAGEWAWEDFLDTSLNPYAAYRTQRIMQICDTLGIGYSGWSWNGSSPNTLNMVSGSLNNTTYNTVTDISDWGRTLISDPTYGWKATAQRATVFNDPLPAMSNPPSPLPALPSSMPTDVRIILDKVSTNVPEGGSTAVRVKLSKQPLSSVTLNLSTVTTEPSITYSPSSLVFTTGNWNQYQTVLVSAGADGDTTNGTGKYQFGPSAGSIVPADFVIREIDSGLLTGSVTLAPTADRRFSSGGGTLTSLTVDNSQNNTMYMKFDLSPRGGRVSSATLRVYKTAATSGLSMRVYHALSDNWTEAGTTGIWASYPVITSQLVANAIGFVDFDVTSAVASQLLKDASAWNSVAGTICLAIRMVSGSTTFQTREGTTDSQDPQLVITTVPAIPSADVVDVSPDPRSSSVSSVNITFSGAVSGFDLADLSLTRDGSPISLAGASLTSGDNITWTLNNLASLTDRVGSYQLTLTAAGAGITDANDFALVSSASDAWIMNSLNGTAAAEQIRVVANGSLTDYYLGGIYQYSFNRTLLSQLTIAGAGADDVITLDYSAGNPLPAAATVDGGANNDTLAFLGAAGADTVVFNSGSITCASTITTTSAENLSFDGNGGGDNLTINGGPAVVLPDAQKFSSLAITGSASASAAAGGLATVYADTLAIGALAALDLNDNDLAVNSAAFSDIQALVFGGYSSSPDGTKTGIISTSGQNAGTTILALFDNSTISVTEWNGQPVGANAIIGKYTYFGDADFNGMVTGDDYLVLDANLDTAPAPGVAWLAGDMNLDGSVTGDDYLVLDANLGLGVGNPLAAGLSGRRDPPDVLA